MEPEDEEEVWQITPRKPAPPLVGGAEEEAPELEGEIETHELLED